jgi:hypothetical protein
MVSSLSGRLHTKVPRSVHWRERICHNARYTCTEDKGGQPMKLWGCVMMVLGTVACGGTDYIPGGPSPVTPPVPALNVSGKWGGSFALTLQDQPFSTPVAMSLQQSGDAISGWWSALDVVENRFLAGQDVGGNITGTLTPAGAFAGTLTWDSPSRDGGRCAGAAGVSGSVVRGQFQMSAASLPLQGCVSPNALRWLVVPR